MLIPTYPYAVCGGMKKKTNKALKKKDVTLAKGKFLTDSDTVIGTSTTTNATTVCPILQAVQSILLPILQALQVLFTLFSWSQN